MAHILYDQGKKIGEISDWLLTVDEPVYKNVLGKIILSGPKPDQCVFVSPKPVNRKSKLTIIENKKWELILQVKSVRNLTVTADIVSKNDLSA